MSAYPAGMVLRPLEAVEEWRPVADFPYEVSDQAKQFGISQPHVSDIVNGKRRRREHAADVLRAAGAL